MVIAAERVPEVQRLAAVVAADLRELLRDVPVGEAFDVPPGGLPAALERYLPALLAERFPQWRGGWLDGIFPVRATRLSAGTVEMIGLGMLGTGGVTPFRLRIRLRSDRPAVAGVRLQFGEPGDGVLGLDRVRRDSRRGVRLELGLLDRLDRVEWAYSLATGSPC